MLVLGVALGLAGGGAAAAATLEFSGYSWTVRAGQGGPGPNTWDPGNVWVDTEGHLHLRLRQRDGKWSCAEVTLTQRLGFGRYEFEVEGPIDRLDDHVVLGLFHYPTRDVGGDATHEIDIEFARWGRSSNPIGNYTVWPVDPALKPTSKTFAFSLTGVRSTHRYDWTPTQVAYRSWQGAEAEGAVLAEWTFAPPDAVARVARKAMPVHFNLWLFQGRAPKDGREVEIVVRRFRHHPLPEE